MTVDCLKTQVALSNTFSNVTQNSSRLRALELYVDEASFVLSKRIVGLGAVNWPASLAQHFQVQWLRSNTHPKMYDLCVTS